MRLKTLSESLERKMPRNGNKQTRKPVKFVIQYPVSITKITIYDYFITLDGYGGDLGSCIVSNSAVFQ